MKDVGARGRIEGDSGEKAGKWVRGEDDDGEEKEGESDEARWRERDTRGRSKIGMVRGDHNGSLQGSIVRCRKLNNKPNKKLQSCGVSEEKLVYIQILTAAHPVCLRVY